MSFIRSLKLHKIIKGKNIIVMDVAKVSLDASVRYLASSLGKHIIRPIRILLAKGVGGFKSTLKQIEEHALLRRNVTQEEVGNVVLLLFSDLASGVIGENIHVDSGYPILG
ncbi:SDR family oxidoreductase [Bacillus cereus]|nr:SDR family oxidoreductase [Bacillus cereus]